MSENNIGNPSIGSLQQSAYGFSTGYTFTYVIQANYLPDDEYKNACLSMSKKVVAFARSNQLKTCVLVTCVSSVPRRYLCRTFEGKQTGKGDKPKNSQIPSSLVRVWLWAFFPITNTHRIVMKDTNVIYAR